MKITQNLFIVLLFILIQTPLNAQKHFFRSINENDINQNGLQRVITPLKYNTTEFNISKLNTFLSSLPEEKNVANNRNQAPVLTLPMPDGSSASFRVWRSSIQEPGLEVKFPEIKTFAGQGIDDPYATIRFDITPFGFHAQVLTVNGDYYIDPYARGNNSYYISYYRKDNMRQTGFSCEVKENGFNRRPLGATAASCRGNQLFTYRLAIACTGEYAVAVGGTTPALLHAAIVTTVNRVVGVYENELSIRLVLVANNDQIEFLNKNTDPFKGNNDASVLIDESQTVIDNKIGLANYDIGHTFSTGGGGLAALGVVCFNSRKASGITGNPDPKGDSYDIDYVAHEMGHQFGASHTFNTNASGCGSERESTSAYEVGGGTSIMSYAGLCGTDDIQPNSNPYFHATSFDEIIDYVESNAGNCKVSSSTGNTLPQITSMSNNNANIPLNTPFTLNATATDADGDAITYSWEEWDLGPASTWNGGANSTTSPIFKSRIPKTNGSRTFPTMQRIIANYLPTIPPADIEGLKGETLPRIGRTMKFRLTVRDNRAAGGGVVSGGSGCQTGFTGVYQINAISNTGPFLVSIPNGGESWVGGTARNITWDVAGTNVAPINTANVKISLSTDGGLTYPTVIIESTPNDGSETLNIPNTPSTTARIKIEAVGNIYFDISNNNFTITAGAAGFNFSAITPVTVACGTPTTTATLTSNTLLNFSSPISLSASGNPAGTTVSFGTNQLTPGNSTTISVEGINSLSPGTYNITITGTATGATTQTATASFTVNPGTSPIITTQPADVSVCAGGNATFVAAVQGSGFIYQWQVSNNGGSTFVNIPGEQSASYTINSVNSALNNNQYRVNISNNCSNLNSNAATLKINTAPAITTQPADVTVCSGDTKTLSVIATGSNLDYQWQISTNSGASFTNISSAKSSTISLNNISTSQNNEQYKVIINGSCPGTVNSNTANLTVNPSPVITATASKSLVCTGTPVTLTASGAVTYSWSPVSLTGSSANVTPIVNPAEPTKAVEITYTVRGTDAKNCSSTKTVKVTAKPLPQVSLRADPANVSLTPGKTIKLTASASPSSGYSFIWKKNGNVFSNNSNILTVGLNDLGSYTVEAIDAADNCNGTSAAVQIKDSVTQKLFVYPNPNYGQFNIAYYNGNNNTSGKSQKVTIFDSHGARVFNKTYTVASGYNIENINVPNLASGIYLVVINDNNGDKIYSEKVLIKH